MDRPVFHALTRLHESVVRVPGREFNDPVHLLECCEGTYGDMARGLRRTVAAAAGVVALALGVAGSAYAEGSYAEVTLTGGGGAYAGTVTLAPGFPATTFTSDSRASATVPTGASNWLSAATPWGAVYGSSVDQPYLNLRPAADAAGSPSTTTYTFDTPTPAGGWGFALGDIDSDLAVVSALDASGEAVAAADLGFEGTFNYCDASPRPSGVCSSGPPAGGGGFDLPAVTTGAESVTLTGNGPDSGGSAGWFRPAVALSTLTIEFAWQTGFPVYHTWFATELRSVAGTVTLDGATPQAGVSLTLTGPSGEVVATTTTGDDGGYAFAGVAPGDYDVAMTVPDGLYPVGPSELPASAVGSDVVGVDFDLTADEPEPEVFDVPGTVTDPSGDPVPDAEVVIETPDGDPVAETTTDDDGDFVLPDVPAGDYDLVVTPPDAEPTETPVTVPVDEPLTVVADPTPTPSPTDEPSATPSLTPSPTPTEEPGEELPDTGAGAEPIAVAALLLVAGAAAVVARRRVME